MNWIRQSTRLALYLRDGLACAYCGEGIEDGAQLTLDHIKCHTHGGSNRPTNLLTCCKRCNSSRGKRSVSRFVKDEWDAQSAKWILRHVRECLRRKLPRAQARDMIERRGSVKRVLKWTAAR